MAKNYSRLLDDQDKVDHFLKEVLQVNTSKLRNIHYKIIESEKGTIDSATAQTLDKTASRDRRYVTKEQREALQQLVVDELFQLNVPDNDDKIKLGFGGSRPAKIRRGREAYVLIGLPASGKSGIAAAISRKYSAMILDADFAKRKLPEFSRYSWGASIVHQESANIVFGFPPGYPVTSLYARSLAEGYNMVIPKIGSEVTDMLNLCNTLASADYKVHLTLVALQKRDATVRALHRFYQTKRYVPLSLIFDVYGNDPFITYYTLKNKQVPCIKSYGAVYTGGGPGDKRCVDIQGNNPAKMYPFDKKILI